MASKEVMSQRTEATTARPARTRRFSRSSPRSADSRVVYGFGTVPEHVVVPENPVANQEGEWGAPARISSNDTAEYERQKEMSKWLGVPWPRAPCVVTSSPFGRGDRHVRIEESSQEKRYALGDKIIRAWLSNDGSLDFDESENRLLVASNTGLQVFQWFSEPHRDGIVDDKARELISSMAPVPSEIGTSIACASGWRGRDYSLSATRTQHEDKIEPHWSCASLLAPSTTSPEEEEKMTTELFPTESFRMEGREVS